MAFVMATVPAFAGDHHHGATIERFPDGSMRIDPADDSTVIGVNPGVKVETTIATSSME